MKHRFIKGVIVLICVISSTDLFSQELSPFFKKTDAFFKENIKDGKVAYKKIQSSPEQLNELMLLASKITIQKSESNQYRGFWINVYNLTVIKSVVDHFPIKSPLDVSGFFDKRTHNISGQKVTLNSIENDYLRAQFNNDPRFHFVLVCAGLGCPPIINGAYFPDTLEKQLDKQTKLALNKVDFIKVNAKKKRVQFSQIFEWYNADFTQENKSLIDFVNGYRDVLISNNYKQSYYTYDWTLNQVN